MRYLSILLLFLPFVTYSKTMFPEGNLFLKESKCTPKENQNDIVLEQFYLNIPKLYNEQAIIENLKSTLVYKGNKVAKNYEQGIRVKSFEVKYSPKQMFPSSASLTLEEVESCTSTALLTQATIDKLIVTSSNRDEIFPEAPEFLTVTDNLITKDSALGSKLGSSYSEMQQRYGRFTVYIPINETYSLTLLGSKHAFLFKNDTFIGYQYSNNLIPTSLGNMLEFVGTPDAMVNSGATYSLSNFARLTEKDIKDLESTFKGFDFTKLSYSNSGNTHLLDGLTIGDWPKELGEPSNNPCYRFDSDLGEFIKNNKSKMTKLVDKNRKASYLTGCMQQLSLGSYEVNLLEQWTLSRAKLLVKDSTLALFTPWTFFKIKEGDSLHSLRLLNRNAVEVIDGETTGFTYKGWKAEFLTYEDAIYSGNLIKQ